MKARAAAAAALFLTSCAAATNYTDPRGPGFSGAQGAVSDPNPSLRVVTFNVAYGREIGRAIACLQAPPLRGADLVLLQEMHARGAEKIAAALGMNYIYYPSSVRPGESQMGVAVLSPWPIAESEKLILPLTTRVVHRLRIAAVATVRIEGVTVRVYSLHLGSPVGMSGAGRGEQAEAVLADARQWTGPVIVAGDFNSRSVGSRFTAEGYSWPTGALRHTVGLFSFDHVFVRGLPGTSEAGVARECLGASDHFPVWADLRDWQAVPGGAEPGR